MANLVISCVGSKALYPVWMVNNDQYDIVLIHYEFTELDKIKNEYNKPDNVTHIYESGSKFQLIQSYLDKYGVDYDYYLCIDDDVLIHSDDIIKLFNIAKDYDLQVFHPSIAELNYRYEVLFQHENSILRYVNWLELMCVGFSKGSLLKLKDYFSENQSGWGYPNLWYKLLNNLKAFACIDLVNIIHTRKVGSAINTIYNNCGGMDKAYFELQDLFSKHSLPSNELATLGTIHQRPLLSVVILYNDNDQKLLGGCLETLPYFAEIVLMKTEPADDYDTKVIDVQDMRTEGLYKYPKDQAFHFSKARNTAGTFAHGDYILYLDPDERLLIHQHKSLQKSLTDLYKQPQTGGVMFNIMSCQPEMGTEKIERYVPIHHQSVRLARKGVEYRGGAHESLEFDLMEKNLSIIHSTFKIDHLGYELSEKEIAEKAERNVRSAMLTPELLQNEKLFSMFNRDHAVLHNFKKG